MPGEKPVLNVTFLSLGKQANRHAGSYVDDISPAGGGGEELADGQGGPGGFAIRGVRGGGRNMHAVTDRLRCKDDKGTFELITLDAPTGRWANDHR